MDWISGGGEEKAEGLVEECGPSNMFRCLRQARTC